MPTGTPADAPEAVAPPLRGRRALVTGGGTGLGRVMALALGDGGAHVTVCGRRRGPIEAVAAELAERSGGRAIETDVADPGAVDRLVRGVGPVDVLVNNAACWIRTPWPDTTPEEWRAVMAANVEGPFRLCQKLAPGMVERRWGRIINVGSILGRRTVEPRMLPEIESNPSYFASKAALHGLTVWLAGELGRHGVTVNTISPGYMRVPARGDDPGWSDEVWRRLGSRTPVGRPGEPGDLHGLVLLLASPASSYLTGQEIRVDGGWTVW